MTLWIARAGAWLLQQGATSDTVLMRQVGAEQSWFDRITGIASGLMTISILVLTAALVPAAWNFRKSYKKISDLLDKVYGDVNPLMRHASTIADNVDYISTSIRVDVQQVNATIALANRRLAHAVEAAERRLQEFDALLGVMQEEAEGAFISTAATVRGVRAGAEAFERASRRGGRPRDRSAPLTVDGGADEELADAYADEPFAEEAYRSEEFDAVGEELDELTEDRLTEDDLTEGGLPDEPPFGSVADALHAEVALADTAYYEAASSAADPGETTDGDDGEGPPGGQERPRIRPRRGARGRAG